MEKAILKNEDLKVFELMTDQDKVDVFNFLTDFKHGGSSRASILLYNGKRIRIQSMNYCDHKEDMERLNHLKKNPYRRELTDDGKEVCHSCQLSF